MANVLPPEEKESIKKEYSLRFVFLVLSFVSGTLIVALIFLLPTYFISLSQERATLDQIALLEKAAEEEDGQEYRNIVEDVKNKVSAVQRESLGLEAGVLLDKIVENRPPTITLYRFSYIPPSESTRAEIAVSGNSANRNALLSFVDDLESEEEFLEVGLPVSQLARENDLDFSLRIMLKESS